MKESIEKTIGDLLVDKSLSLATAESCTGGLISHRITNVDGSSRYYLGSINAYAYEVKMEVLKVNPKTLEKYGAVSAETVSEMAVGVCQLLNSDIGISVSGIAGPGGGTLEKPVGLVYFGLNTPDGIASYKKMFAGDRIEIKEQAAEYALGLILQYLQT